MQTSTPPPLIKQIMSAYNCRVVGGRGGGGGGGEMLVKKLWLMLIKSLISINFLLNLYAV